MHVHLEITLAAASSAALHKPFALQRIWRVVMIELIITLYFGLLC
jgi:hypothetical protein